jgi:hypothetical protein
MVGIVRAQNIQKWDETTGEPFGALKSKKVVLKIAYKRGRQLRLLPHIISRTELTAKKVPGKKNTPRAANNC